MAPTKESMRALWRKGRARIPHIRFASFEVVSTLLLYTFAALSLLFAVYFSAEWADGGVSNKFLLSGVIFPFVAVATAFGIQIVALLRFATRREQQARSEAKFLAGLDRCHEGSIIRRSFLGHLLDQWDAHMDNLSEGVITIQKNYWSVCAELYDLARERVECTSRVPLEWWEEDGGNKALLDYKREQIEKLINRKIPVRRTFVIEKMEEWDTRKFLDIANAQLGEGFCIYYVDLSEVPLGKRGLLAADFGLIDDLVLMLGRQSAADRGVYFYDFFELGSSSTYPKKHRPALDLMSDSGSGFLATGHAKLLIEQYGKSISEFPALNEPEHKTARDAIMSHVEAIKCWRVTK